jgi:GMP synthase-like glutamine amidotransferase
MQSDPQRTRTIGILACDHVAEPLRAAAGGRDYDAMYADMLQAAEPTIDTRTYDVVGGELPASPDECDAWIITGARYDAYADDDWIVALRKFVAGVHEHQARLVGVCFGHQVVAHALGGRAENTGTWQAGPKSLHVEQTAWFEGGSVAIHAMHQDVVGELPAGARTIARGDTAEHPMFLVGDTILCVQDHPEYDAAYIAALVELRRPRMGDAITDEALARIGRDGVDGDVVARWITDFLLDRRR